MKQPEDHKTLDLLESHKRGRGRPRLLDAMTAAERARRYRENKKMRSLPVNRDVTENAPSYGMLESRVMLLNSQNMQFFNDLQLAQDRIRALSDALACCLQARASKKRLSDGLFEKYVELLKNA